MRFIAKINAFVIRESKIIVIKFTRMYDLERVQKEKGAWNQMIRRITVADGHFSKYGISFKRK